MPMPALPHLIVGNLGESLKTFAKHMTFDSATGYYYHQLLWHQSHMVLREEVLSP